MNSLVTLQGMVERVREGGDRPALIAVGVDTVETRNFSTVADEVEKLSSGLLAAGLDHGEPVGIYAEGGPDWIIAFLAIVAASAVAVPFDISLKGDSLAKPVRASGCRRFFVTPRKVADLQKSGLPEDAELYLLDNGTSDAALKVLPWRDLATVTKAPLPVISAGDQAVIFYTSGTTGTPKGVPLTHANLVANINALVAVNAMGSGDRVLLPLPPHHVYPLVVGILAPLAMGIGVVFPPGISGPQIVDALRRGEASVLVGVPRLYSALLDAIDARIRGQGHIAKAVIRALFVLLDGAPDAARRTIGRLVFRRVRTAFGPRLWLLASGGAHLEAETWRALERFGWTVLTGYGLTETAPILTFNPFGHSKIGSAGKALSNVEVRITHADKDGIGEIEARGPNVFEGYRDQPQETAAAFTRDGWFRTGDLGRLDHDGYLYVVGRAKELIILPDGKNIFPETIEAVYSTSPLIQEIAVLEQDGTLVGLIVPDLDELRKRGAESAPQLVHDEIRDLSSLLAPHERLSGQVLTRSTLPRTAIGKLKRHQLPELYRSAKTGAIRPVDEITAEDEALLSASPRREIWDWLHQRFPDQPLSLDVSPQLDLGIDSLGWTGLSLEIEDRFGVSLSEERIARIITLRDLLQEVDEAVAPPLPAGELSSQQKRFLAPPSYLQRLLGTMLYGMFRLAMRGFFRLRVVGFENVPKAGPFIIVPNHASWLDPLAIAASLSYAQIRQTRFAGWTGVMFVNVVSRAFSWATRVFPVNPDRAAGSSLALARAVLDHDEILVWFPEGRRTRTGSLQAFQPGVGALLEGAAVPAVPAYIVGTFQAAPTGRLIPTIRQLEVRFGAPVTAEALVKLGRGDTTQQRIANALQEAVAALEKCKANR